MENNGQGQEGQEERRHTPTPGIAITLDRERVLRFTWGDYEDIEKEFGEGTMEKDLRGPVLRKVVWLGLRHEDPSLKIDELRDLIDLRDVPALVEAVRKALQRRDRQPEGPQTPAPEAKAEPAAGAA